MLKLNATHPIRIVERPIATGASIGAEGMPLIQSIENGEEHVTPSTTGANDVFVGFSYAHNIVPTYLSRVEAHTVPAASPYTVQLERNNVLAANVIAYEAADLSSTVTEAGAVASGNFTIVDATGVMTFHSDEAGLAILVVYRYTPTALELSMEWPHLNININPAFTYVNNMGVIVGGEVYTDQFDAGVDWANSPANVYLGTAILTGSGNVQISGRVIHAPDVDNPFLGISFGLV
jgi:hypothetical protein